MLNQNIEKLKANLGENWMSTPQGKDIFNVCEKFSQEVKENIRAVAKFCENQYKNKSNEPLFSVRKRGDNKLELHVNINQKNKEVIKAIRYLCQWYEELNKQYLLKFVFKRVVWPSYISMYMIENAVNSFNRTIDKITPTFQKLLATQLRTVYVKLEQASQYKWFQENDHSEDSIVEKFALTFGSAVQELALNTQFLQSKIAVLEERMANLRTADSQEAL